MVGRGFQRMVQAVRDLDDARRVMATSEENLIQIDRRVRSLEEQEGYLSAAPVRIYTDHDIGQHVTMIYMGKKDATFYLPALEQVKFTTKAFFVKNASAFTVTVTTRSGMLVIDGAASVTLSQYDTLKVRADKSVATDLRWWIE